MEAERRNQRLHPEKMTSKQVVDTYLQYIHDHHQQSEGWVKEKEAFFEVS